MLKKKDMCVGVLNKKKNMKRSKKIPKPHINLYLQNMHFHF